MLKVNVEWSWVALIALPFHLTACGAATDTEAAGGGSSGNSVGTATEAFGESTCGSAPADVVTSTLGDGVNSPNASYNHSQCTHSFVEQVNGAFSFYRAFAAYQLAPASPCNAMWSNMSLWQLVGSTYTKVGDAVTVYGTADPNGNCLQPSAELQVPTLGTFKIIGQAGYATSFEPVKVGTWAGDTHDMSTHDSRGFTADGDWAPGLLKGECISGRYVEGVARMTAGAQSVRNILCRGFDSLNSSTVVLDFTSHDDRRTTASGNWDAGLIRGECPAGSVITGLAQTTSGIIDKALCTSTHDSSFNNCHKYDFSSSDKRANLEGGDWSPGDFKGQCDPAQKMTGISKDASGKPKSILCCSLVF